jgi:hypothetical protein
MGSTAALIAATARQIASLVFTARSSLENDVPFGNDNPDWGDAGAALCFALG